MKLYVAGPMSSIGPPTWNRPAFFAAQERLEALGHEVVNPAALDVTEEEVNGEADWAHYLRRDLAAMLTEGCEGIVLLPGFEQSKGAQLELHVARALGLKVFHHTDENPLAPERRNGILWGLCGFANSGKDEVAKAAAETHGALVLGLGDLVRDLAYLENRSTGNGIQGSIP